MFRNIHTIFNKSKFLSIFFREKCIKKHDIELQ